MDVNSRQITKVNMVLRGALNFKIENNSNAGTIIILIVYKVVRWSIFKSSAPLPQQRQETTVGAKAHYTTVKSN